MVYAIASLNNLATRTREVVDVQAVRLERLMSVQVNAAELATMTRNIVLEVRHRRWLPSRPATMPR